MRGRVVWALCAAGVMVAACGGGSPVDAPTPAATSEPLTVPGSERSGAARVDQTPAESGPEPPSAAQPSEPSTAHAVAPVSEPSEATPADSEASAPTAAVAEHAVAAGGSEEDPMESGTPVEAQSAAGSGEETSGGHADLEAALVEARFKPLVAGAAPLWPFRGLVQLWQGAYDLGGEWRHGWVLRYWAWDSAALKHRDVVLPGLEVDCLGQVALVFHGELGMEFGGAPGAVSGGFWVPWGGIAEPVDEASVALLEEVVQRSSNVAVGVTGDVVRLGQGSQARDYLMRDPVRPDGERWSVQARHDGDLFVLTVHPAHLDCMSGVSWVSLASTGELAYCGANTAAMVFVAPDPPGGALVLPGPDTVGTYLSCPATMDLRSL